MPVLPAPPARRPDVVDWVRTHLGHLCCDEPAASPIRGGQAAADAKLAALDLTGYASRRSTVLPVEQRGASGLSPYLRHGLLTLAQAWEAAPGAPARDRQRFRDELLWQEYARHLYARLGTATADHLRYSPPRDTAWAGEPWRRDLACVDEVVGELERDGWLVNQTRMWLASQWAVRAGGDWREGALAMYRHLLDGSPAANRLGWQWSAGTATGKPYGFSRWQVEKRAPALCRRCALRDACPIQEWPDAEAGPRVEEDPRLRGGTTDAGPREPELTGEPDTVWLTAESLAAGDPALAAHPELPAVFVVDEPLLRRLRLSGKRLVFLAETLAELAVELPQGVQVRLGDPVAELAGRRLAVTWAPVPGFARRAQRLDVAARHPWPWLRRPASQPLHSYSAWVRKV